jgi:membrane associated rhomboid family serine protease
MDHDPAASAAPRRREPLFNAPWLVALVAGVLVLLHLGYELASARQQTEWLYEFALVPQRFFADAGDPVAYGGLFDQLTPLITSGFLHANWLHVIVNAAMLLSFGTPVARWLGPDIGGLLKWIVLYLGAVAAGALAYLALNAGGGVAVGASGGVSGLMAAAFLIDPSGGLRTPFSRPFLGVTFMFAAANVVLALAGPYALGMGIAWEAHAGGYIAGALLMLLLGRRPGRTAPAAVETAF